MITISLVIICAYMIDDSLKVGNPFRYISSVSKIAYNRKKQKRISKKF